MYSRRVVFTLVAVAVLLMGATSLIDWRTQIKNTPIIYAMNSTASGGCGMKMDGVSDDTAALSNCITSAFSGGATNLTIMFPAKTAGICDLVIDGRTAKSLTLLGSGEGTAFNFGASQGQSTVFKYLAGCTGGAGHQVISVNGYNYPGASGIRWDSLTLDGGGYVPTAVVFNNAVYGRYTNWTIQGNTGYGMVVQPYKVVATATASNSTTLSSMVTTGIYAGMHVTGSGVVTDPTSVVTVGANSVTVDHTITATGASSYTFQTASSCGQGGGWAFVDNLRIMGYTNNTTGGRTSGGVDFQGDPCSWHFGKAIIDHGDKAHGILLRYADSNVFGDIGIFGNTDSNGVTVSNIVCTGSPSTVCTVNTSETHGLQGSLDGVYIATPCSIATTGNFYSGACGGSGIAGLRGSFLATPTTTTAFTVTPSAGTVSNGTYYSSGVYQTSIHLGDFTAGSTNSTVWANYFGNVDVLAGLTSSSYTFNSIGSLRFESGGGDDTYYNIDPFHWAVGVFDKRGGMGQFGAIQLGDRGSFPTCNINLDGLLYLVKGGAGVKDSLSVCAKDATDTYAWRTIY